MTWQGRNSVDDDGDGLPNLLDRGVRRQARPRLRRRRPARRLRHARRAAAGLARPPRPPLRHHHRRRAGRRARPEALEDHKGVLLPSDVRWLPRGPAAAPAPLRARRRHVASLGIDSLRRQVALTRRGRLIDPTPPAPTDLFGVRLRPLPRLPKPSNLVDRRRPIDFFAGTAGAFGPFSLVAGGRPRRRPPPARSPRTPRPGGRSSRRRASARAS